MIGKWVASLRRNKKTGSHTVHYLTAEGTALCGRPLHRHREPTINGEPWDINHTFTCQQCKGWYILFFGKGTDPVSIQDAPVAPTAPE